MRMVGGRRRAALWRGVAGEGEGRSTTALASRALASEARRGGAARWRDAAGAEHGAVGRWLGAGRVAAQCYKRKGKGREIRAAARG
jgi:hypothetical protein